MNAQCPRCHTELEIPDEVAEKSIQCVACSHYFRAPAIPPPPAPVDTSKEDAERKRKIEAEARRQADKEWQKAEGRRIASMGPALVFVAIVALLACFDTRYTAFAPTIMLVYIASQLRTIACDLRTLTVQYRKDPPPGAGW